MSDKTVALAELLLRRKELNERVERFRKLEPVVKELVEVKATRKPVHEGVDDVVIRIPKFSIAEFTRAHDDAARKLRMVDALIQKTNWDTQVATDPTIFEDYKVPEKIEDTPAKA